MNVYITNIAKFDISIKEKTLKPGSGDVFSEEVSKQDGVVAFAKKGWLKVEMVKEFPEGVAAGVVPDNTQTGQPSASGNDQPHDTARAGKRKKGNN